MTLKPRLPGLRLATRLNMFKPSNDHSFPLTVPRWCFRLLLMWIHFVSYVSCLSLLCFTFVFIMLPCLFLAALWSPAGKGLTSWLSCVLCFLVFCLFPICFLIQIRTKGEVGTVKHVQALL